MMNRAEFDRQAEAHRALHILAVRDGEAVFRADYDEEIRRNQYSATKSFTSAPARRAADRRLCGRPAAACQ